MFGSEDLSAEERARVMRAIDLGWVKVKLRPPVPSLGVGTLVAWEITPRTYFEENRDPHGRTLLAVPDESRAQMQAYFLDVYGDAAIDRVFALVRFAPCQASPTGVYQMVPQERLELVDIDWGQPVN